MSDQDNLFKTTPPKDTTQAETPPSSETNTFVDQLKSILNENGEQKYKDIPTALGALTHSQQHIATLEAEKATREKEITAMREELSKTKSVEDFVSQLTTSQGTSAETTKSKEVFDPEKVVEIVNRQLQATQEATLQQENLNTVLRSLKEKFGDKAAGVIKQRAAELHTTPDQLEKMSKDNPYLAISLFGSTVVDQTPKPTATSSLLHTAPKQEGIKPPEKSLMRGATTKDVSDYIKGLREQALKDFGVS